MLSKKDIIAITDIIEGSCGQKPSDLHHDGANLRFNLNVGEEKAEQACQALLAAGLQSTPGDGIPEYNKNVTDGALMVGVTWPIHTNRPTWNE